MIVKEALMIEPTETESKTTLDAFISTMGEIAAEAREQPDVLRGAPRDLLTSRLDEVRAARELVVCEPDDPNET